MQNPYTNETTEVVENVKALHANSHDSNAVITSVDPFKVTFFPPLQEQRRGWILSILRRERVCSVVDIGCGEGSLLQCLCNPARFLCGNSDAYVQTPEVPTLENPILEAIHDEENSELLMTSIAGLDIDRESAQCCASATVPSTKNDPLSFPRWSPLDVKIFCGSLTDYNPAFVAVDCIVSTEVIEHLPPSVLPLFAPMLLGTFRPRLLLITTPSYAFNARFSAPGKTDPSGYLDPTGRTDRVFRHSDHKFEWTPDEFRDWCEAEASRWGYEVEVDGIGRPREEDPWGRDDELGWATQVATFRRKAKMRGSDCCGGQNESENGVPQVADHPGHGQETGIQQGLLLDGSSVGHELIVVHHYDAHPCAGKSLPREEITSRVLHATEEYYSEEGWTVWSLWVEETISTACGGYLQELLGAVLTCTEFELIRGANDEPVTRWRVIFSGARHEEALAKMRREQQGWMSTLEDEADAKSLGSGQVLWEAGGDDWQQRSWASPEGTEEYSRPPAAIGEEVDWGRASEASWGS